MNELVFSCFTLLTTKQFRIPLHLLPCLKVTSFGGRPLLSFPVNADPHVVWFLLHVKKKKWNSWLAFKPSGNIDLIS